MSHSNAQLAAVLDANRLLHVALETDPSVEETNP